MLVGRKVRAVRELDVNTALVLRELMQSLAARGKLIFYSSHVLEVVEKVCSRVLILHKGRVVADGAIEQLRDLVHEPSLVRQARARG